MGRPAKPIEQKLREGNAGKRSLPAPVAFIPGQLAIPDPPDALGLAGQRFWSDTWSVGLAWLSPNVDYPTMVLAARAFDECEKYRLVLSSGALLKEPITTASGKIVGDRFVANPAELMLRRAERQLERWLVLLAIPPTARARLGLVQVQAASLLDQMKSAQVDEEQIIDADWEDDDGE